MLATTKTLSLVEQKKLQWAKEREEMVGLYGLWGRPKNDQGSFYTRSNLLPPIPQKNNEESPVKECSRPEDESETSGYLSDSPKRSKKKEFYEKYRYAYEESDPLNNEEVCEKEAQQNYWTESDKGEDYWAQKKMYKNYKIENWDLQNNDLSAWNSKWYRRNKNCWLGTPESVSSDDGSRLRWGDRGVGIGHLWKPVINPPDCRLPRAADHYRQAPKWVEKGLKNFDGSKSEVLIINHPDDEQFHSDSVKKNYILGQNAPISPEVIEEREKKRKKAIEHQNEIKKQLEERELIRKKEKERRVAEERLEEERIKKEQEIERLRYEEEQRRIKAKEEADKKREEVMKEGIEMAERRAREEKKRNKRHVAEDDENNISKNPEKSEKLEKMIQPTESSFNQKKQIDKKCKKSEGVKTSLMTKQYQKEQDQKKLKDSSSQFEEEIQLANSFQLLNVNGVPMDGGLALMLDNNLPKDGNFILPPDGLQLALLMSPRNAGTTNRLIPLTPSFAESIDPAQRILTPSKYRLNVRSRIVPSSKATQTDFVGHSSAWFKSGSAAKRRRLSIRSEAKTGSINVSQRCGNSEKLHKPCRCFASNKQHRSKSHPSKINLEDRPKWGTNRPSVQYKKQSEKDPNYQKRLKEKWKSATDFFTSSDQMAKNEEDEEEEEEEEAEKELDFVVRLLELPKREDKVEGEDEDDKPEMTLKNGYRMNSNCSSPVFVPIDNRIKSDWKKGKKSESNKFFDSGNREEQEDTTETEEITNSASRRESFLTPIQLEAIEKITSLREVLKTWEGKEI